MPRHRERHLSRHLSVASSTDGRPPEWRKLQLSSPLPPPQPHRQPRRKLRSSPNRLSPTLLFSPKHLKFTKSPSTSPKSSNNRNKKKRRSHLSVLVLNSVLALKSPARHLAQLLAQFKSALWKKNFSDKKKKSSHKSSASSAHWPALLALAHNRPSEKRLPSALQLWASRPRPAQETKKSRIASLSSRLSVATVSPVTTVVSRSDTKTLM